MSDPMLKVPADSDDPTLKIRVHLGSGNWGRDCHTVAQQIIDAANAAGVQDGSVVVLDAKWGRHPHDWAKTRDWGRQSLTPAQLGYVNAVRDGEPSGQAKCLLAIIDSLVKR